MSNILPNRPGDDRGPVELPSFTRIADAASRTKDIINEEDITDELLKERQASYKGRDLKEIDTERTIQHQESILETRKDRAKTLRKNSRSYNAITTKDLLTQPWTRYEHLQTKVIEMKAFVSDVMKDQGITNEIADARAERGYKYDEMYSLIEEILFAHLMQNHQYVSSRDSSILVAMVANEILGLGPIEPLWRDDSISEIMVNGPTKVRIERSGKLITVPGAQFRDSDHALDVARQILSQTNHSLDSAHPLADGSLVDGSRMNATHPSVGPRGPYITIRRFPDTTFNLKDLVAFGSMSNEMAEELGNFIASRLSLVVVGGTSTGKTSVLNALSGCIPPDERVIVLEDTPELRLHEDRDVSYLNSKPAQQKDSTFTEITIRKLVANSMRMRPERIVVGEVRDGSAFDMLQAMNTGHNGSMTTTHANDARGGVERLVSLLSESGESAGQGDRALALIASGIDLFVTLERYEDGSRRCSGIYEIPSRVSFTEKGTAQLDPIPLWEFDQTGLDENDKIVGTWTKKNDLSESIRRKHRLDHRHWYSLEEIFRMSAESDSEEKSVLRSEEE